MPSKYDDFWREKLNTIGELLRESRIRGRSREVDVSELSGLGKRQSWFGVVEVSTDELTRGEMAHARSLGRTLVESGLLQAYPESRFRATISSNLKLRIELAKADSDQRPSARPRARREAPSEGVSEELRRRGRVEKLVNVLKEIPLATWQHITEWPAMIPVHEHLGFARFSVFLVATGLNDYQLKGRAEEAYWPPLCQLVLDHDPPDSPGRLLAVLEPFYAQERLGNQKRARLARFLRSSVANGLWNSTPADVAEDFASIWMELASLMGQRPSAKTIAFAMKCLGWSLLMSGRDSLDFAGVPIPVDSRVRRFMKRAGISFGDAEGAIQRGWERVLVSLREDLPSLTMLHLDTLIWEIGTRSPPDILGYFEELGLPDVGRELTSILHQDSREDRPTNSAETIASTTAADFGLGTRSTARRILVIFPCSGSKSETVANETYSRQEERKIPDSLVETRGYLLAGREGNGRFIDTVSPPLPAIDRYDGFLYRAKGLKDTIATAERSGDVHAMILSGAYGVVRPSERIHMYNCSMNVAYWTRYRLPDVISEYIARNGITEVHAFVSRTTDYAKLLPRVNWPGLSAESSLEVARAYHVNFVGTGGAQRIVPRLTGDLIVSFVRSHFPREGFPPASLSGQPIQTSDLLNG